MPDTPKLYSDPRIGFDQLLSAWPDQPLPNIAKFDTFSGQADTATIQRAVAWIEPQQTCTVIAKHHGPSGLQRVLKGIAKAAADHKIPMLPRVKAVAEFYGYQVY